ncbi:hypothetical protein D9M72_572720 [compost metagenome]
MEHRGEDTFLDRSADFGGRAAKLPGPCPVEANGDVGELDGDRQRRQVFEGRGERRFVMAVFIRRLQDQIARGHVDRRNAADEAARFGARRVDVALADTVDEFADRVSPLSGVLPQAQKHVVMAIENRLHS